MTSELEDGAMKMSTRGRYGLRVMMELALHHGKGPVPVETIANNQEISGKYIHNLMSSLHSAGLARTVRGPKGGYELARPPSEITALDAVEALEGKNVLMECVADASSCRRAGRCAARDIWCEVASSIDGVLRKITLAELANRQRSKQKEAATYSI